MFGEQHAPSLGFRGQRTGIWNPAPAALAFQVLRIRGYGRERKAPLRSVVHFNGTEAQPANQPDLPPAGRLLATLGINGIRIVVPAVVQKPDADNSNIRGSADQLRVKA